MIKFNLRRGQLNANFVNRKNLPTISFFNVLLPSLVGVRRYVFGWNFIPFVADDLQPVRLAGG
jgi:hypothetical protein